MVFKIAFVGPWEAGKDIAGGFIRTFIDNVQIVKFSDPLYTMMSSVQRSLNLRQCRDRLFLQLMGVEWGRRIDPFMWVRIAENRIKQYERSGVSGILVTDVRFKNEVDMLRARGFTIVKISRDRMDVAGWWGQRGETELTYIPCDFYISDFDGDRYDFLLQVSEVVKKILL